jgi:hypothetical protein
VATSTKAAETHAALEGQGKMRFTDKLSQEMGCTKATLIEVTDSTTLKAGIVGTSRQLDGTVQIDILELRKGSRMVNYELHGVDHKNNLLIPVQRRKLMLHR